MKNEINIYVIIEAEGNSDQIEMSMEEYIEFIKEQSKLLNIKEEVKPLMRKPLETRTTLLNSDLMKAVNLKNKPEGLEKYINERRNKNKTREDETE